MAEPTSDKHYETHFESSLLKLIRQRAEEKDISYSAAANEVLPEYDKTLSFGNTELEDAVMRQRLKEMAEIRDRKASQRKTPGVKSEHCKDER